MWHNSCAIGSTNNFNHYDMLHDLETDAVIDINGILTVVPTESDIKKVEDAKEEIIRLIEGAVKMYYNSNEEMSKKIAALDVMNELEISGFEYLNKQFIKEMNK